MLTKEETNANMVWFLMIFGTLGSFIVLCVAGVGVVECIISVKNCRHSSQHEPANESTGTESGDHEGNNSSQPSSTEGQTNSAYQPDAGLAYQQGACVMVCTAASLSAKLKPIDQRQSSVNETPDHLTDFS
ncbi:hypothetical protein LSAT2_007143 [Lamellibrachia satsuma]|nr:hypothetical protein LSAT2_007143 [Lamellibrachia satsuma]